MKDFDKSISKDDFDDLMGEDIDIENEVEMNKTMWLVLRKTKPSNQTLKNFYTEPTHFNI